MESKPHPGKDGDARTCLGPRTGRTKHHPAWDLPVMGFPRCFGVFFPYFQRENLDFGDTKSGSLLRRWQRGKAREGDPKPLFLEGRRCSARLANFPARKSRCEEPSREDAADVAGFVPLPSCSLCPFVCFLPRHLEY